jgi:hypothetical protein
MLRMLLAFLSPHLLIAPLVTARSANAADDDAAAA